MKVDLQLSFTELKIVYLGAEGGFVGVCFPFGWQPFSSGTRDGPERS